MEYGEVLRMAAQRFRTHPMQTSLTLIGLVVGTAALRDFAFGERLVHRFGATSIVAALDVRALRPVPRGFGGGGRQSDLG